ncbi:MAG: hypothetical protein M1812_004954 [Candelaria pacifica]|nr:MAG: hypothetical protein M1812_004954 [Candelaria pacifica]
MQYLIYISMWALLFFSLVTAIPRPLSPNPSRASRLRRDIPSRPDGVSPNSFHGDQFRFFDENGFVAGSPAVEAAPVFLYSRTTASDDPCYPESAVLIGSNPPKPNPGTGGAKGVASFNPGVDCTDPGPYVGPYSLGNAFPVYTSATWCGGPDNVWKLNYDLYYVHDGNLEAGHKHDWEGVTIIFAKDPAAKGGDWWYRAGAQYNHHSHHDWFMYSELHTVTVDIPGAGSDVSTQTAGLNLNHPKVYVGFFSHSAYDRGYTGYGANAGMCCYLTTDDDDS